MNDPVCVIMAPFATAVLIVFLVLTYRLLRARMAGREVPSESAGAEEGTRQLAARAARIERRLENLETILVDHRSRAE